MADVLCKIFNVSMKKFLDMSEILLFYYFIILISILQFVYFCFVLFRYIFYANDSQFLVFNSDILIWMEIRTKFIIE